jgi:hypothetical protein
MSDDYPRVWAQATPGGDIDCYTPAATGPHKVVPVDAIVIEPQDFSDAQAQSVAAQALGFVPRTTEEIARLHQQVIYYASALARLTAHPPVDEAEVEALTPVLHEVFDAEGGCRDGWLVEPIARALAQRGVTLGGVR